MIPNQWYAVLSAREVRPGKPVGVTRLGQKLVFWRRQDGTVGCLADQCCHRGAALSCGKVAGDEVVFGTADGRFTYRVDSTEVVLPDAVWIIDQTRAHTATLFACHPPHSTRERIVVHLTLT